MTSGRNGDDPMKALAYLLGSRALDAAFEHQPSRTPAEPDLPPIASTPETAAAWRQWAREAADEAWPPLPAGRRGARPARTARAT